VKYDVKTLRASSMGRIKNNEKFQHLLDSMKWYKDQKEKTKRSLVLADYEKERKEVRERTDLFKKEEESKNLKVVDLSNAKDKAQIEKFEDFSKTLKKDPVIEESFMILNDMMNTKS
jgi:phage terminase Nu1 subunit (DNA packaging protein)